MELSTKFSELNDVELNSVNGGIFPFVILGITFTAKGVATAGGVIAAGSLFGVGVYHGLKSGK